MPARRHLLIIDPQNDFCDLPPALCGGHAPSLPVAGAHADMQRVAGLIDAAGAALDDISVTLDSHQRLDIAHPGWWPGVAAFTEISAAAVRAGQFTPRAERERVLAYLDALEATGRYKLMVWPVHCELGSWGHNIHADVLAACDRWEDAGHGSVFKLLKGLNPWTEHYSAVQAEVPLAEDPATQLNRGFIERLKTADTIYIGGEAASHCVKATTEHLADAFGPAGAHKLVLLTDCMSPVSGFERAGADFLATMRARGLRLLTSAQALDELRMPA